MESISQTHIYRSSSEKLKHRFKWALWTNKTSLWDKHTRDCWDKLINQTGEHGVWQTNDMFLIPNHCFKFLHKVKTKYALITQHHYSAAVSEAIFCKLCTVYLLFVALAILKSCQTTLAKISLETMSDEWWMSSSKCHSSLGCHFVNTGSAMSLRNSAGCCVCSRFVKLPKAVLCDLISFAAFICTSKCFFLLIWHFTLLLERCVPCPGLRSFTDRPLAGYRLIPHSPGATWGSHRYRWLWVDEIEKERRKMPRLFSSLAETQWEHSVISQAAKKASCPKARLASVMMLFRVIEL